MLDATSNEIESTEGTIAFENPEAEWAAVLAAAPAMGRLPEMVASTYTGQGLPGDLTLEEFRQQVHDRVLTGSIFIFKLISNNVNRLFEQFDVCFGNAIDLLMDDLEEVAQQDHEEVENYSAAEVCGRLFAYIAMSVYCRHRCLNDGAENPDLIDDATGLYKDMDPWSVCQILESVYPCVNMEPTFRAEAKRHATLAAHTHIFLLLDKTQRTTQH